MGWSGHLSVVIKQLSVDQVGLMCGITLLLKVDGSFIPHTVCTNI